MKEPPQLLEALEREVVLGHGDEERASARKESEPSEKEEIAGAEPFPGGWFADKIRGCP